MLHDQVAPGPGRRLDVVSPDRRGELGATSSEYIVIAGLMVCTIISVMVIFRTKLTTAVTTLGCKITSAVSDQGGSCGGGGTATAGGARTPTGGSGGPLTAYGLVPVGPARPGGGTPGAGSRPGGAAGAGPGGNPYGTGAGTPRTPAGGVGAQVRGVTPGIPPGVVGAGGNLAPPPAGQGPMAPGGPTVTPGFPSTRGAAANDPWMTGSTIKEVWLNSGYNTGVDHNRTTARHGSWVGQGWSGGSENPDKVGAMPPEDELDALGQAHDFAYAAAEEAGRLYGEAEKYRLLALADEIGHRAWQQLPRDPRDWKPPAKDPVKAAEFRDRFPFVMRHQANKHESARLSAPPPTPAQAAALAARGPVTAADLRADANRRVQAWNVDRGRSMRARGDWK